MRLLDDLFSTLVAIVHWDKENSCDLWARPHVILQSVFKFFWNSFVRDHNIEAAESAALSCRRTAERVTERCEKKARLRVFLLSWFFPRPVDRLEALNYLGFVTSNFLVEVRMWQDNCYTLPHKKSLLYLQQFKYPVWHVTVRLKSLVDSSWNFLYPALGRNPLPLHTDICSFC